MQRIFLNRPDLILLFYIKFRVLYVVTCMFVQPYQRIAVITLRVHSIIQDIKTNTQEPKKKKLNASFSHRLQALICLSIIIDGHISK